MGKNNKLVLCDSLRLPLLPVWCCAYVAGSMCAVTQLVCLTCALLYPVENDSVHAHYSHCPSPPSTPLPLPLPQHELKAGVEDTFYIEQLTRHLAPALKEAKVKTKLLAHLSPLRKVLADLEVDLRSTADDA